MELVKQIAERPKVGLRSSRYAKQKLEKDLKHALAQLDTTKEGMLTFDLLGQFMHFIGVYRILYNPEFHVHCKPDGDLVSRDPAKRSKGFVERRDRELEFHINLWRLLKRQQADCVDSALLIELLLLLSDSAYESVGELAAYTEGTSGCTIHLELLQAADRGYRKASGAGPQEMQWTCEQLIKSYKSLNPAPLLIPTQKPQKEPDYSFNPAIDTKSRKIAERSASDLQIGATRVAQMYNKQRATEERLSQLRQEKSAAEMQDCTFHPIICNNVPRQEPSRPSKSPARQPTTEERELEKCTFHPEVKTRDLLGVEHRPKLPRGYEDVIQRMRRAGKENQAKAAQKAKIPAGENYQKNREMKPLAPSMCVKGRKGGDAEYGNAIILKVDVDVACGKKGTIVVRRCDDLLTITSNFARTFQLGAEKAEMLYHQLKRNTEGLLSPRCRPYSP